MQMHGKVLTGTITTITTRKGASLAKTRIKVLDAGPEAGGDVSVYWVDLLGDCSLSESELDTLAHQEAEIEIRRISPTLGKDGKAYLNLTGGAVRLNGAIVQVGLRASAKSA